MKVCKKWHPTLKARKYQQLLEVSIPQEKVQEILRIKGWATKVTKENKCSPQNLY